MGFDTKTPEQAKALLDSGDGWRYVDVRTVEEFDAGHPTGACNVPAFVRDPATGQMTPNPDFLAVMRGNFAKDAPLVVGCAAGGRSMQACRALDGEGFANLVNMDGGFQGRRDPSGHVVQAGWVDAGFATASNSDPESRYETLRTRAEQA